LPYGCENTSFSDEWDLIGGSENAVFSYSKDSKEENGGKH
jgi:hypothetical protein